MQPLHLHVEHRLCVDLGTQGGLNVLSQPFLVRLLDGSPFLLEFGIIGVFEKTGKFLEVLEPLGLGDFESLGDERGETGITLIDPAAGGHLGHSLGS